MSKVKPKKKPKAPERTVIPNNKSPLCIPGRRLAWIDKAPSWWDAVPSTEAGTGAPQEDEK